MARVTRSNVPKAALLWSVERAGVEFRDESARGGSELETIGATYVLRKTEGEWKIAVVMSHPPANVIRAD